MNNQDLQVNTKRWIKIFIYFEMKSSQKNILKIFNFEDNSTFTCVRMIILRTFRKKLAEIVLNSIENSTRPNRRPKPSSSLHMYTLAILSTIDLV